MGKKLLSCLALGVSLLSFNPTIQAYPQYFSFGEPAGHNLEQIEPYVNLIHAFGWGEEGVMNAVRFAKNNNLKAVVPIDAVIFLVPDGSGNYTRLPYILDDQKIAQWNNFIDRLIQEGILVPNDPEASTVFSFYLDEPDLNLIPDDPLTGQVNPNVVRLINLIKQHPYTSNFPTATAVSRQYKLGPGESNIYEYNGYRTEEFCRFDPNRSSNCKFTEALKLFDWIGVTAYMSRDQEYLRDLDDMEANYPNKKKILIPKAALGSGIEDFIQDPDVFYPHVVNNPNVIAIVPFDWGGLQDARLADTLNKYKRMGYEISYQPKLLGQSVPPTMYIGEFYPVSITIKNEGSKVWLKDKVKLGTKSPDNNTMWGTNRLELPYNVAPGETVTVQAVVGTPTSEAGIYPLQVQLIVDDQFWIGEPSQLVNVEVKQPDAAYYQSVYNPRIISQTAPSSMYIGELAPVSITLKNEGTKTWPKDKVRLGTKNPDNNTIWGTNRLDLPHDVAPGETVVINEVIGTPVTGAGTYPLQVQLIVDEQHWIGSPSQLFNITVKNPDASYYQSIYSPRYVSQSAPTTMYVGELKPVSITFKNEGTQTWPKGKVRLGTKSPDNNTTWGTNRLDLPHDVAPGETVTIQEYIGSPASGAGTYALQVQLIVDDQYWIGSTSQLVYITVKNPDAAYYQSIYNPRYITQSAPVLMYVGEFKPVSITFKNEGTQTWPKGKVRLGTKSPDNNTTWGTNRLDLPRDVLPGETVVINEVIGTPLSGPGSYRLQVQLIVDEKYWIGSPSQLAYITVRAR